MSTAVAKRTCFVADKMAHLSVTFKLVTPDQLKRIDFTLTRLPLSGSYSWTVLFEIHERLQQAADFQPVVKLHANIDRDENNKAAATAANGLSFNQFAQVLIAAETALKSLNGNAVSLVDAQRDARAVVSLRNS